MSNPAGEAQNDTLRVDFDRRVTIQFRGSVVTSDAGLLAYRELDDAPGLSAMAGEALADERTGKNGRHALVGMLRQSVFGRLAGYEDVNDAERLRHDPVMRWIVGGRAAKGRAASPSQMGRFETRWLAAPENLRTLVDLSGQWIDRVRGYRSTGEVILDMDSSVSPTHGEQEQSIWNGHFGEEAVGWRRKSRSYGESPLRSTRACPAAPHWSARPSARTPKTAPHALILGGFLCVEPPRSFWAPPWSCARPSRDTKPDLSSMMFYIGTWKCHSTVRGSGRPDTTTYTMDYDGRWIKGHDVAPAFDKFRTRAIVSDTWTTYNDELKKWVSTSVDNFGGYGVSTSPGWVGNKITSTAVVTSDGSTGSDTLTKVSDTETTDTAIGKDKNGKPVPSVTTVCKKS
jgi:DDE family transposase